MQEGKRNEPGCCLPYSLETSSGSLPESSSHFPSRCAALLQAREGGGMVSALVCCRSLCWGNQPRCVCRGGSQPLLPLSTWVGWSLYAQCLKCRTTWICAFMALPPLNLPISLQESFVEDYFNSDTKLLMRFDVAKISKQCCALTNPRNLGRSIKWKYTSCDSCRFLYS